MFKGLRTQICALFDYNELDVSCWRNRLLAFLQGRRYDPHWHDYEDAQGELVFYNRFRERPLDPTALK